MEAVKQISSSTLKYWLETGKQVSIIDIRPAIQRFESSIPGSIHADVYDKLKQNDSSAFSNFYADKLIPVVAYCRSGKTSLIAAAILTKKGYNAFSLEGGLDEWNEKR